MNDALKFSFWLEDIELNEGAQQMAVFLPPVCF